MKKLAVFTGLALLFFLCATTVSAAPAMPHAFYGTVQINEYPAPIGTSVEARGEGVDTGIEPSNPTITTALGIYGISDPLEPGPGLLVQGAILDGATITFYVNNVSTGQTAPWHSGEFTELPLTVTIPPTISYSPSGFSFTATKGGADPAGQTLNISNSGVNPTAMNWSVSDDADWLSLSPASGSSSGEVGSVTLSVSISGKTAGSYSANITISSPGATNTPQTVPVGLIIDQPTATPTPTPTGTPIGSYGNGTVAASGGTVNTTDGKISVEFPNGSFNASTNVSIQGGACHAGNADFVVGSTCFNITPDGELGATARICVNLSADDFGIVDKKSDLTLGYWADGSWNVAGNITITGSTICGETTHLSDWAVLGAAVNETPTPTPTPTITPTPTHTSTPTHTPSQRDEGGTNWVLIGGIAGGVVLLILLAAGVNNFMNSKKNAKRNRKKTRTGNKKADPWE